MIGYSAMSYGDLITATFLLFCECCVLWFWSIDNSNFFILLQIKDFWWLMFLSLTSYLRNSLASVGWRQITIIIKHFLFLHFWYVNEPAMFGESSAFSSADFPANVCGVFTNRGNEIGLSNCFLFDTLSSSLCLCTDFEWLNWLEVAIWRKIPSCLWMLSRLV